MANPRALSRLKDILIKAGLIDELQLRSAVARMDQWGGRLPAVLVDMGFVDEEQLGQAIGAALKMPLTHLGTVVKDPAALSRVDVAFCEQHAVFPVLIKDRVLTLAMADPTELGTIDAVSAKAGVRVVPALAAESEIQAAIARHYRGVVLEPRSHSMRKRVTHDVGDSDGGNLPASVFQLDLRAPPPAQPAREPQEQHYSRSKSANTMLDEILGDEEERPDFTPEELVRLDACRLNQQKASRIVDALRVLLREKGILGL